MAQAEDEFTGSIAITPAEVEPGGTVHVEARCDDPNTNTAPISSPVLNAADLIRGPEGDLLYADSTVRPDVDPSRHPVSFTCGTKQVLGYFRVIEKRPEPYAAIGIQDREIRPGQEVRIIASCNDLNFASSKVISSALTAPVLQHDPNVADPYPMAVFGRINEDAKPGTHTLAFYCAGKKVIGEFEILAEKSVPVKVGEMPVKPERATADQVPVKPKGAPQTGGTGVEESGSNTGLYAGAGAVLLGGAGFGVWALRRRRQEG